MFWEWWNGRGQARSGSVYCMSGRELGQGRVRVPVVCLKAIVVLWYEDRAQEGDEVFVR